MKITLEIVIAILIAVLILWSIRRFFLRRLTGKLRDDAHRKTDKAMNWALDQIVNKKLLSATQRQSVKSKEVADVWGRGVMAFEYSLRPIAGDQELAETIRSELTSCLEQFTIENQISSEGDSSAFVITDLWLHDESLHLDVAYLMNESTLEYLRDLKKLNETKD